jgi:hypothetical protein
LDEQTSETVAAALVDFQRYLLDLVPPLTVADSVETLMQQPPAVTVREMNAWALEENRMQSVAVVDCLFHALKKIHLLGSLKLFEREEIDRFLESLTPGTLQVCPPEYRDLLRSNIAALRSARHAEVSRASFGTARGLRPPEGTEGVPAGNVRLLSLMIERLARIVPAGIVAQANPSGQALAQPAAQPVAEPMPEDPVPAMVAMATANANSEQELKTYMDSLAPYTAQAPGQSLFRILSTNVPDWDVKVPPEMAPQPPAAIKAMHKIITLTKNPTETGKRFRELLESAMEQFNAGSLSAAVSLLELADVVIVEKNLDKPSINRIRTEVLETINAEQLKKYSESKARGPLLRKALSFFPTLSIGSLLEELRFEERPERRRSILGLLEAHGTEAREAALVQLETELARPAPDEVAAESYYLRNLIYLLHRIPRDADAPVEKELTLLTRASAPSQPTYVAKEAILPLGQIKSDAAVKLLTTRLAEYESMLLRNDSKNPPEVHKLLDRIVAALGRIGTPSALLTVARHGVKPNPLLGDTRARLAALSQHDLSFSEDTVNVLVSMVRDEMPGKLLGKILPKRQPPSVKVIEALSNTRSEVVESLLKDVARRFPDQEVGRVAASAVSSSTAGAGGPANPDTRGSSLTGDLQFFGLPALLQSLADSSPTGVLTLFNRAGLTAGKILFDSGKFIDAQVGHLRGTDALFKVLERPVVGTFAFTHRVMGVTTRSHGLPLEVMPLIFEGMRRHDELKQMSALVPDDLVLQATNTKPSPLADESDPAMIREVWLKASSGEGVGSWEKSIPADPYRVRRLIVHWLEEGSLHQVIPEDASKASPASPPPVT